MSRIGIAVWNFAGDDLAEKLRRFVEMGYTAASINIRLLDTLSDEDEAEASRIMEEHDLVLTFHGGLKNRELQDEPNSVARAERIVRWHQRTGRVANASYDTPHVYVTEISRRADPRLVIDQLETVLEVYAGTGIRVLLEDCPIFPWQAEYMSGVIEKHPNLGILVDLGHMNLRLREPNSDPQPLKPGAVEEYLRGIPSEICELHVHSNDGSRDQHGPPYAPNADLVTAARVLKDRGFDGISTVELVPKWCGLPEDEIEDACRKSLAYWRGLL